MDGAYSTMTPSAAKSAVHKQTYFNGGVENTAVSISYTYTHVHMIAVDRTEAVHVESRSEAINKLT